MHFLHIPLILPTLAGMSKEVIVVDGVRYIREDAVTKEIKNAVIIEDHVPTFFRGCVYEDEGDGGIGFCFEASNITEVGGEPYGGLTIQFTDKTPGERELWKEHYLDNEDYLRGLLKDEPECVKDALKFMNTAQLAHLVAFLDFLEKRDWFEIGKKV